MSQPKVEIAPFSRRGQSLAGFVVAGRWPDTTREWVQFLTLAVRLAAVPGVLTSTTVFRTSEDVPDSGAIPDPVGLVLCAGPVVGDGAPVPGALSAPIPSAVILLHPPQESVPSTPDAAGAASGCVLLPGLPHLGLDHRAAWVEAEADGTLTQLRTRVDVDPATDPDTAVLAMLLAA
ncbi:MAG: peptidase [Actinomycetales bacterium]